MKVFGWLTGFEPATLGSTNQYSNQLSYSHRLFLLLAVANLLKINLLQNIFQNIIFLNINLEGRVNLYQIKNRFNANISLYRKTFSIVNSYNSSKVSCSVTYTFHKIIAGNWSFRFFTFRIKKL